MEHRPSLHASAETCTVIRLAETDLVSVDRCSCGTLRIHLGALTLRVSPEVLEQVVRTLGGVVRANASLTASQALPLSAASPSKPARGQS